MALPLSLNTVSPDFCGWPDPSQPGRVWTLTGTQWYLVTKALLRELARANAMAVDPASYPPNYSEDNLTPAQLAFRDTWNARVDASALLLAALASDPCKLTSVVPWGQPIDWAEYGCFASWLTQSWIGTRGAAWVAVEITEKLIAGKGADAASCTSAQGQVSQDPAYICPPEVYTDPAYQSGLVLLASSANPADPNNPALYEPFVQTAWQNAGFVPDQPASNGYPAANAPLVSANEAAAPTASASLPQSYKSTWKPNAGASTETSSASTWLSVAAGLALIVGVGAIVVYVSKHSDLAST